ncbi:hypothetical protein D2C84_05120 [Helicobacter pylori]|nr:hypothetical protein D2C86_02540 [Helicobacter pylori]QEF26160.1 hypothetical protein D2C84_05120 [Helicobacter pylori]
MLEAFSIIIFLLFLCRNSTISGFRLFTPKVIASLPLVGISALFNSSLISSLLNFVSLKSRLIVLFLLASLISSLACLTPLVSSSMSLSVLLLKWDFCALKSKFLLKSLMLWLLSNALFR